MKPLSLLSLFKFKRSKTPLQAGKLFSQLMQNNNEIVVILNSESRIIYRSPAATRISGWTNDEIQHADMLQRFINAEDLAKLKERINTVMVEPGSVSSGILRATHKNGQQLYLEGSISFIKAGTDGDFVILNVRDVTDRFLKEQRLEENAKKIAEQEKQLQLYVEHSPASIAMFDTNMRYLVASRRWLQDYKLEGKQFIGASHYDIFPEISPDWKAIHTRCLQGAVEKKDEDLFVRADGSNSWLRWEVRPWYSTEATVGGLMIFTEDITERKRTEAAIALNEEKYRTLVERVSDGFVALDTGWNFTYINRVAEEMLNTTAAAVMGKNIWEVFPETANSSFYNAYHEAMAEQKNVRLQGFSLATNRWMDVNVYPSPTGLSIFFRDITAEKIATDHAQQSDEKYHSLIARISDGFIAVDNNWIFVYANSMAEKMFGYDASYLVGKNLWDVFPNAVGGPFYENYVSAMQSQQHTVFTNFSHYAKKWMQVNVYPSPSGLSVYFRDITEQVNAEAATRKSEETRRLIMSSALDAIVCVDNSGAITFWNNQAVQLFGWERAEVRGKQLIETIIPPQYKERHIAGFNRFLQQGRGHVINNLVEMSAIDKTGREFPVELFIVQVKTGSEPFFCAFIRDITERKTKEKELVKTNERLKRAQEIAHLGSVEVNFETNTSIWSDEARSIYGLEPGVASLSPKLWLETIHPDDIGYVKEMIAKTIQSNAAVSFYHRIILKNGEIRHVLSNGKFECQPDGKIRSMHGIVHDITELKKLEMELLEQQQKEQLKITAAIIDAEEKERNAIGEELHDNVNQILTGIFLQLSRLRNRQMETEQIVETSMEYLKKAINENRKISKELITPEFLTVPLVEQLDSLVTYMLGGTCKIILNAGNFSEHWLDEKQKLIAYRVLQEQCTNITKYASASCVNISLDITDGLFTMSITDDGIGMDSSLAVNGIGLRNIKSRLSSLNGTASITTMPGAGFRLEISFPVKMA